MTCIKRKPKKIKIDQRGAQWQISMSSASGVRNLFPIVGNAIIGYISKYNFSCKLMIFLSQDLKIPRPNLDKDYKLFYSH